VAVKEAVLPFKRFRTRGAWVDSLLGPEMKSTGEVMGIDTDFGTAFAKSQLAGVRLLPCPAGCSSRRQPGQAGMIFPVKRLAEWLGFNGSWPPPAPGRCCGATASITTVQQLGAAVLGIEAMQRGDMQVSSLQEHAARLDLHGRPAETAP
jgi:hypothetical protein